MDVVILDPTVKNRTDVKPAARLSSLCGQTIGFLDNGKEKADVFLAAPRRGAGRAVRRKDAGPPQAHLLPGGAGGTDRRARESCDAVVTAMGA